jgi:adenosylhomocysteinase
VVTRIRDEGLADAVTAAEQAWWRTTLTVSTAVGERVAGLDLRGMRVACFHHVLLDHAVIALPLVRAGARVRMAAVNADSTNDTAAAFLVRNGVEVWAWTGMTEAERLEGLDWLLSEPPDAVSDMGGETIAAAVARGMRPLGALEATMSGLHRLRGLALPFPVYNWNDAALKDRIHNRHHVGLQTWPAFSDITGLAIHGRTVLVVGFGPVGRGVALRARDLGAIVSVAEADPVRAVEAQHHGCRVVDLDEGLAAAIVVTATGRERVLGPEQLRRLRPGAIVFNVGHSNREIDVDWLDGWPHAPVRRHVERYEVDGRDLFLLNRGSLLNIAPGAGIWTQELFDPFAAMILQGLAWILGGGAAGTAPGMHPYPPDLEREIAELARNARS